MSTGYLRANITSILAMFWSALAGVVFVLVLIGSVKADEKIVYFVLGALVNQVGQVLSYYFGASKTPIPAPLPPNTMQSIQKTTVTTEPTE